MTMIDHLIRFDTEEQALNDPALAPFRSGGDLDGSRCIAGVRVWRPADDTTEVVEGETVVSHSYLPYWYVMVSTPAPDASLRDHPTCMLVTDREAANAGEPDFVLHTAIPPEDLGLYMLEPVFAGSNYPFGEV